MRYFSLFFAFLIIFEMTLLAKDVKIGIYQNKPKYFLDEREKPSGFFGELIEHIGAKNSWNIEYIPCEWNECLKMVENGAIDLMADVAYSNERAKIFDFNKEIALSNWTVFYTNKYTNISSVADLNNKRVALLKGSIQEQILIEAAKEFNIKPIFHYVGNFLEAFTHIEQNLADVCAVNGFFGKENDKKFEVYKSELSFNPSRLHFITKKETNKNLLDKIDAELKTLKDTDNSFYYKLYDRWFNFPNISEKKLILSEEEKEWLKKHPHIKVGINSDLAPIVYFDEKKPSGIVVELLKLSSSILNINFDFTANDPSKNLHELLETGKIDILSDIGKIDYLEKTNIVEVGNPIPIVVFTHISTPRISDLLEFSGHRVGVVNKCAYKDEFTSSYPHLKIIGVNDYKEAIQKLRDGEIDAFIGNQAIVAKLLSDGGHMDIKIAVSTTLNCIPQIGVRSDWSIFAGVLRKTIDSIPESEKSTIRQKFMGVVQNHVIDYSLLWKIGAGFVLILAFILFWNLKLKKEISERKKAEKKLKEALEVIKETQVQLFKQDKLDSLNELITNIAHHWRQPLSALSLYIGDLEDAKKYNELDDEYLSEFFTKSQKIIDEMSQMIDNFRNFYISSEEKSDFSLKEAISDAISMINARLGSHGINLFLNLGEDIKINGYKNEFIHVLLTILRNANDALLNSISKEKRIMIALEKTPSNTAKILIEDNGGGISEENINKIFEPYFTTKFKSKGVGTNLYLSKVIIEKRMHGSLSAYNGKDGAVFAIEMSSLQ